MDDFTSKIVIKGNRKERGAKKQHYFESLLNRSYKYYEKDMLEKVQENVRNSLILLARELCGSISNS